LRTRVGSLIRPRRGPAWPFTAAMRQSQINIGPDRGLT
jgi:hypothetical protein